MMSRLSAVFTWGMWFALTASEALAGAGGGNGSGHHIKHVPEPASLTLLAVGVGAIVWLRSRRRD